MRGRLATAALLLLALVACTSDDGGEESSGSPTPSGQGPADAAEELAAQILADDEVPDPLVTVTGELPLRTGGSPVAVDVLEVRAGGTSTLLRWRLRSPGPERADTYTSALSRPNRFDTRAVALVDEQGGVRLQPYTYVPQRNDDDDISCVCSELPDDVGPDGLLMYALYPPLDASTRTVDVAVPGLQVAEDVEVTRP